MASRLRILLRRDDRDALPAFRDLDLAGRRHLLVGRDREGLRGLRCGFGLGFLTALVRDGDRALLPDELHVALGLDLGLLHRPARRDVGALLDALGLGFALGDEQLGRDPRRFLRLPGGRFLLGLLGAGLGRGVGDVPLLAQLRLPRGPVDLELALKGLPILLGDGDLRVPDDLVALLLALLRDLGERRQAFGVEAVVGVEVLDVGLVEARQRHALELEAVRRQVGCHGLLDGLHELRALLLEIVQRHRRGDRAQGVDELRLDELAQRVGIVGAVTEGLGREGDENPPPAGPGHRIRPRCPRACGRG